MSAEERDSGLETPAMIQFLLISKNPTNEHEFGQVRFGRVEWRYSEAFVFHTITVQLERPRKRDGRVHSH